MDSNTAVSLRNITEVFNVADERFNSLKEYAIAFARHEVRFKPFNALDDISFDVPENEVFGLVGTNGSGKSTLLKVIAGVLEPTYGTCETNGHISPLIELSAGMDPELTAFENLYLNGSLLGYSREFIDEYIDDIIDFAEIRDFIELPIKNYSSGMLTRLAFSAATAGLMETDEKSILLADEILSVGDFMFQQKCLRRIRYLIDRGNVTVLFVSHDMHTVRKICDHAVWIEKGHQRIIGTADDVCDEYAQFHA